MPRANAGDAPDPPRPWLVPAGTRIWVGGNNRHARRLVEASLNDAARPPRGPIDIAFVAPTSVDEALYFTGKLKTRLQRASAVWVVYPPAARSAKEPSAPSFRALKDELGRSGFVARETVTLSDLYVASRFEMVPPSPGES